MTDPEWIVGSGEDAKPTQPLPRLCRMWGHSWGPWQYPPGETKYIGAVRECRRPGCGTMRTKMKRDLDRHGHA